VWMLVSFSFTYFFQGVGQSTISFLITSQQLAEGLDLEVVCQKIIEFVRELPRRVLRSRVHTQSFVDRALEGSLARLLKK
jgi:hypothetical protein